MDRDAVQWAVDLSTVAVGLTAAWALWLSARERRAASTQLDQTLRAQEARFRETLAHQTLLDHHARIYEATTEVVRAVTVYTRRAEARVLARGRAMAETAWESGGDESIDPAFARILDAAASLEDVYAAYDEALQRLAYLWFLVSPEGAGRALLTDIELVRQGVEAVRPYVAHDAGSGNLEALVEESGLDESPMNTVVLDVPRPWGAMTRLRVVRDLAANHLRYRVGEHVPAPPIAN